MTFWNKAGSVAVQALLENQFKEFKQELKADLDRMEERLGKRVDEVEERLGNRIDEVEERLGNRIDEVEERLGNRIDKVETRLQTHEDKCVERHGENQELKGSVVTLLALAKAAQGDRLAQNTP